MPASPTRKASGSSPTSASAGELQRQPGRPAVSAALHRRQAVRPGQGALPLPVPRRRHRGVPLIAANPNPERLHQPRARVGHQQPDRRHRLERAKLRRRQQPVRRRLRHPRHRAREPGADLASGAAGRVPRARRASNGRTSPRTSSRVPTPIRSRRTAAAWSGPTRSSSATTAGPCTWSTTVRCSPTSPDAPAVVHGAEVGRDLDHHLRRTLRASQRRSPDGGARSSASRRRGPEFPAATLRRACTAEARWTDAGVRPRARRRRARAAFRLGDGSAPRGRGKVTASQRHNVPA